MLNAAARFASTKLAGRLGSPSCVKPVLHQESPRLVRAHARVGVGDVNTAVLAQTRMTKSLLDAGWTAVREQPRHKASRPGVAFAAWPEMV